MERLTDKINGWTFEETVKTAENLIEVENNIFKWDVLSHLRDFAESYREKLAEYEDLEEQGRLLKLPCKVGDTVYIIKINTDACHKCLFFEEGESKEEDWCGNDNVKDKKGKSRVRYPQYLETLLCNKHFYEIQEAKVDSLDFIFNHRILFDKTIFPTKSEAEAKLSELRGGKDEADWYR